jgi:uncharacterized protein YcbK (DUF882 family)
VSDNVWLQLKHFKITENWGDPEKMDPGFLRKLDAFRASVGYPFEVHEGYATSGHAIGSYHYKGMAVDGRFTHQGKALSLEEHIAIAMKAPFGGIGIYTWSHNGPFLHLDDRPIDDRRRVWVCEQAGQYSPFSGQFLLNHLSKKS